MIDTFRFGYSRHSSLLSLSSEGHRIRPQLTQLLIEHPSTAVVRDVGGEHDLLVELIVCSPQELSSFQDLLASHCTGPIQSKNLSICRSHSIFGEKSLVPDRAIHTKNCYQATSHLVHIDSLDRRPLFLMSGPLFASLAQLARDTGEPLSTIDYRVKKLKERRVICGDLHDVRGALLGLSNFILLVSTKGFPHSLHNTFHTFVRDHPYITYCSYSIGTWDFMLGVSIPLSASTQSVTELVHQRFGSYVTSIKAVEMLRTHKVADFPFTPLTKESECSILQG